MVQMKNIKRILALLLCLLLVVSVAVGCAKDDKTKDIVILYTNDVHCGIEDNIGYAGLAAYKDYVKAQTPYVTLIDCGDAIQGDVIGTVSSGEYIVQIMNAVGYDFAVLGNHEFDYGMEQLSYLIDMAKAQYIGANITYSGDGENLLADVKPYQLVKYGKTTVAFIGATTPLSVTSSTPAFFMDENGNFVYGFTSESPEAFYSCFQGYIDECREKGADYVIVCAHLGETEAYTPYSSVDLINNTTGIDVVLDAHNHSTIPAVYELNKNGEKVLLSSTGTKLANIGQLVISENGYISTTLISSFPDVDPEVVAEIENIKYVYEDAVNTVVATSNTALSGYLNGVRLVRSRETAIGNLCADAYRYVAGADIAFVNGGGIRADLPQGNITFANVIAVHPYGNMLCMVTATGQEILDALEHSCRKTESEYEAGGLAVGESGGFLHASGLKYTVDTSVESTVETDANGMFVAVGGERRVKDVYVLNANGEYEPIDPNKTYTVASHNYMIKNGGDGYTMFTDNELLIDEAMLDYQVLITYLTDGINGDLSAYSDIEGRITVK